MGGVAGMTAVIVVGMSVRLAMSVGMRM